MTIGMAVFVAVCQTLHYRTGREVYARMTQFWGKLMLISFAVGVVTGIVQEFQFGMNWSNYSRYVGDIFGAPLAMEGLAAFFLESTFIGLWLFGRGKLSPRIHLASIWALAGGTMLSAYFILAANSWMQHPVGYKLNAGSGRAEMTSILDVLTNSTALYAFGHTILGALATAGMLMLAVCAWHLLRRNEIDVFGRSANILLGGVTVAALGTMVIGHFNGQLMERQQPMKMAAAEALFNTSKPAAFSLFAVSHVEHNPKHLNVNIKIPHTLSLMATNSFNGKVEGINDINREYQRKYGPGEYAPIVAVTYWTFRFMVGSGTIMLLLAAFGFWRARSGRLLDSRLLLRLLIPAAALPFIANSTGWLFTEMGRQPWAVMGLLRTDDANSPIVSSAQIVVTLVGYTLLYGVLGAIGGRLFVREAKHGPRTDVPPADAERPDLVLAY
ncbi:cytochrome ubiquinol oxidase subunit I [Baekduia soli]|uniref:cytochrome ubiquinol oxidase subunit I n=1 Tax=Baekduia soli TaxID=496014 RepID=UPI002AA29B83|nr:cytochrome ubiquinol oxidase subunit I [Baekduia soli]